MTYPKYLPLLMVSGTILSLGLCSRTAFAQATPQPTAEMIKALPVTFDGASDEKKWKTLAQEVLAEFGDPTHKSINEEQFRKYLTVTLFKSLQTQPTPSSTPGASVVPTLLFEDYSRAILYLQASDFDPATKNYKQVDLTEQARRYNAVAEETGPNVGFITPERLVLKNPLWSAIVDQTVKAYLPSSATLDIVAVAKFLKRTKETSLPRTAEWRVRALEVSHKFLTEIGAINDPMNYTSEDIKEMVRFDIFSRADLDGNAVLDPREALGLGSGTLATRVLGNATLSANDDLSAQQETERTFKQFAGDDLLLSSDEYDSATAPSTGVQPNNILTAMIQSTSKTVLVGRVPFPVSEGQERIQALADTEMVAFNASKKTEAGPIRKPFFLEKEGIVFSGARHDGEGNIEWSPDQTAYILNIIKDFQTTGAGAQPATLKYTKEASERGVTDANIALRVSIRPGRQSFTRPVNLMNLGFGAQHDADAKDRLTQLFLTGDLFIPVKKRLLGFIGSQLITFSPIYQFSRKTIEGEADPDTGIKPIMVTNVDRLTGLIQWEPELQFGDLITGQYLPRKAMVNQKDLRFYVLPRLAAEFSSIANKSSNATDKNVNYLRYDFLAGLAYQSVTLQYVHNSYHSLNSGFNDHAYETIALTIPLNPQKTFSLVAEYQNGEKSPEFQRVKEWNIGLGAKF